MQQPVRECFQDFIADRVPKRVIDDLKPIEIHEQNGKHVSMVPGCVNRAFDLFHKRPAIRQIRQCVEPRQADDLAVELRYRVGARQHERHDQDREREQDDCGREPLRVDAVGCATHLNPAENELQPSRYSACR